MQCIRDSVVESVISLILESCNHANHALSTLLHNTVPTTRRLTIPLWRRATWRSYRCGRRRSCESDVEAGWREPHGHVKGGPGERARRHAPKCKSMQNCPLEERQFERDLVSLRQGPAVRRANVGLIKDISRSSCANFWTHPLRTSDLTRHYTRLTRRDESRLFREWQNGLLDHVSSETIVLKKTLDASGEEVNNRRRRSRMSPSRLRMCMLL